MTLRIVSADERLSAAGATDADARCAASPHAAHHAAGVPLSS